MLTVRQRLLALLTLSLALCAAPALPAQAAGVSPGAIWGAPPGASSGAIRGVAPDGPSGAIWGVAPDRPSGAIWGVAPGGSSTGSPTGSSTGSSAASSGASSGTSPAAPSGPVAARNPVVFVHGYNADPGVWGSLRDDLRADGYADSELFSFGYDTHQSVNEVLSGRLAAYVDDVRRRTGAARVDLVAHSFGSLVTRWYVKFGGGGPYVDRWVSLAGPNRGTSTAWACALWDQACRDMTPGSYVVKNLNSGDETPGAVRYATFWSNCDEVINPDDSVPLTGAVNTPVGCLKHNDLLGDDPTSAGVRAFLRS